MAVFRFIEFDVDDGGCGMKISSDAVLFGAWFFAHIKAGEILDVGTGSGVLALMAAQNCTVARITGVELDAAACDAARRNFAASPWAERMTAVNADINEYHPPRIPDAIICNPPYFTEGLRSVSASRATARHCDTLDYATLMAYAAENLCGEGHLGLISPAEYEDEIIYNATLRRMSLSRLCRVRTTSSKNPSRILWDFAMYGCRASVDEIIIKESYTYTSEYLSLVKPYYRWLK